MNKTTKPLILFVSCLVASCYCQAKNYYVKDSGTPGLPGSSWNWASTDLQATVNKASAGDVVYVAAGKYYGGFIMKEGVDVRGGYTANSANPTERYEMAGSDDSHFSILDGEGKQRTLTQLLPFTIPTTWDGFVIQHGNPSVAFRKGSLIYSQNDDNEIAGVLFQYDAESKTGKMVGRIETQKQWGGYENEIDNLLPLIDRESAGENLAGQENTVKIFNALGEKSIDFSTVEYFENGNYAAFWCDTLTTAGYSDWYLPSPGELQEVYNAEIQDILKNVGKNLQYPFWTSSQVGNMLAWAYCFGGAYCHPALKYVTYTVNAVHTFVAPEQPNSIYSAGGGVFLCANGILKDCSVIKNTSSTKGGGAYVGKGGALINCHVEENDAPEGKEIFYEVVSKTNESAMQSFGIYPNPARAGSELTIACAASDALNCRIINVSGQTAVSCRLNAGETLHAPAQKGVYIISIQTDKINLSEKIIIN